MMPECSRTTYRYTDWRPVINRQSIFTLVDTWYVKLERVCSALAEAGEVHQRGYNKKRNQNSHLPTTSRLFEFIRMHLYVLLPAHHTEAIWMDTTGWGRRTCTWRRPV